MEFMTSIDDTMDQTPKVTPKSQFSSRLWKRNACKSAKGNQKAKTWTGSSLASKLSKAMPSANWKSKRTVTYPWSISEKRPPQKTQIIQEFRKHKLLVLGSRGYLSGVGETTKAATLLTQPLLAIPQSSSDIWCFERRGSYFQKTLQVRPAKSTLCLDCLMIHIYMYTCSI